MEHIFKVQQVYNNDNFNTFILLLESTTKDISWLPHHVFLVQTIRNSEYEDIKLELASLFRHIIVSCLSMCHVCVTLPYPPRSRFVFFGGEFLSLAGEDNLQSKGYDIAPGSTSHLLGIPFWLSTCTANLEALIFMFWSVFGGRRSRNNWL